MAQFKQTKVTNISTGVSLLVDILSKTDKFMKVVVDDSNLTIMLHKKTPSDKNYIGHVANMEFSSTGAINV